MRSRPSRSPNHARYVTRAHKLLARVADGAGAGTRSSVSTRPTAVERTGDAYEIATLRIEQARLLSRLDREDEGSFACPRSGRGAPQR